jgi:hypothetical protein
MDPFDRHQREILEDILAVSRRKNPALDITGILLLPRRTALQVLEGPRLHLERLFERIEADPRHDHVGLIEFEPIAQRHFAGWAMAFTQKRTANAEAERALFQFEKGDRSQVDAEALCRRLHRSLMDDGVGGAAEVAPP